MRNKIIQNRFLLPSKLVLQVNTFNGYILSVTCEEKVLRLNHQVKNEKGEEGLIISILLLDIPKILVVFANEPSAVEFCKFDEIEPV